MKSKGELVEECLENIAMYAVIDSVEYEPETDDTFEDGWATCLQWMLNS